MSNKNLKIDSDNAGRRIDNYLFNVYKALPKSKIYSMLRKGEVRVNSRRIKPTHKLKINDEIRIPPYLINFDNDVPVIKIPPSRIKEFLSSIIFDSSDFIVVNKDPELSTHSGTKNQFGLIDIARAAFKDDDVDLCHRIDKSTSGCIVLSKNKRFLRSFHEQLKSDKVTKLYEAIVFGVVKKDFRVDSKIDTSTKEHLHKVKESAEGKQAISDFSVIKNFNDFTHLEIKISTGRMHQIRVQTANIKHPIVNDKKYGQFDLNKIIVKKTSINRLALHSSAISFENLNGDSVSFLAPKNDDFVILLNKLRDLTIKS